MTINCRVCDTPFEQYPSNIKNNSGWCCSIRCGGIYRRKSDEHKRLNNNEASKRWRERHPDKINATKHNEYKKMWYKKNKKRIGEERKTYWELNKKKILATRKLKSKNSEQIQKEKEYHKKYRERNPEKIKETRKRHKGNNARGNRERYHIMKHIPEYKLNLYMGNKIRQALNGEKQGKSWKDILGYDAQELKEHLQAKFTEKMNWGNYGTYWHIDHKIPKYFFKFTSYHDEEFKKCWSLKNLQPLEATENLKKGHRVIPDYSIFN